MNRRYDLLVNLYLKAPLISSSGEDAARGIDRKFYRDAAGKFVLQGSHIKGKLKEAIRELLTLKMWTGNDLNSWFGPDTDDDPDHLQRGHLCFSDFMFKQSEAPPADHILARVAIDKQTGTSRENFLQTIETLFPSGTTTKWQGRISFFASDESAAQAIREKLLIGFCWISTLGSTKGSGYGRMVQADAVLETCKTISKPSQPDDSRRHFHLIFEFDSDLFIGGVVNMTNYRESQRVIPGAVIKGSLARFLNDLCGAPLETEISEVNTVVGEYFPAFVKGFSRLRFSHAFPAPPFRNERPVSVPFSAVKDSLNEYHDTSFCAEPSLDSAGKAPEFQIDWKDPYAKDADFGWARCQMINKTRTRIDPQMRTAKEEMLYTFQYLTPYDGDAVTLTEGTGPPKVRWIANVTFPDEVVPDMRSDFDKAVKAGWCFLGKRNARFRVTVKPGRAHPKIAQHTGGALVDDCAIIALQSDALLFDAYEIARANGPMDLHELYKNYWNETTRGTCELTKVFFTRQKFSGGYISRKFNLAADRHYYPFILTAAGSVFVLRALTPNEPHAKMKLEELQENGLPLPQAIIQKLSRQGVAEDEIWRYCPFVPENGFGEININLVWHWQHKFQMR